LSEDTAQQPEHSVQSSKQAAFELKGSLFTLTIFHLHQADLALIEQHLLEKIAQAPGFFCHAPVVIELNGLRDPIDFTALAALLRRHQLIPVGIRHGSEAQCAAALSAGLPLLPKQRAVHRPDTAPEPEAPEKPIRKRTRTRVYTKPVRSGQQLYAPDGDLIIIGTVNGGAEVLAAGNIHIYGSLRGRALAGAHGDAEARIFCSSLEAELISVAGNYRILEKPRDIAKLHQAVQIYLENEHLIIRPLT
jgi:septum site-determining protein MinC